MLKYYRGTYLNDEEYEEDGDNYLGEIVYNAVIKVQNEIIIEVKTEYFIIKRSDEVTCCPDVTIKQEISKEDYEEF